MQRVTPPLSGVRFQAHYDLHGTAADAEALAQIICVEQTIEFPLAVVPQGDIRDQIVGQVVDLRPLGEQRHRASISFAIETSGGELTQLLNVVFGNISLLPNIRLVALDLPPELLAAFRGPRYGRAGLRGLLGVPARPLLCTALKPMGLPAAALAEQAYTFALGGIDIIKDDHGLANQPFTLFHERVAACAAAVAQANAETGRTSIYVPNVTGPAETTLARAHHARALGAGGLMIAPGLAGLDAARTLADDDTLALPVLAHPAFQGSYVTSPTGGIAHGLLFGTLARLAGADASIFPNYGGRFSFSQQECTDIARATGAPLGLLAASFPAPGGGMTIQRIAEMGDHYGPDVLFLMGGGLHTHSPDLLENTRLFHRLVAAIR